MRRSQMGIPRTHGHWINQRRSPTYHTWEAMMKRCYCETSGSYHSYGKVGIRVCDAWHVFENFLKDMGERPLGMTIERKDNAKGYFKENCTWATKKEQAIHRVSSKLITFNGVTLTESDWSRRLGLSRNVVRNRLKRGWSLERALTATNQRN